MKKRVVFFFAAMLLSIGMAKADEAFTGVFVTTPDGETTYALSEMPKISYTSDGTTVTAQLFLKDRTTPVATVELKDGKTLIAQWGFYEPTGIHTITSDSHNQNVGKKVITGGRLIIIGADGKKYDINGAEIQQ